VRFAGGVGVRKLYTCSSRSFRHNGVRVGCGIDTVVGQRAADPSDTQGSPSAVQDGRKFGAQGTRPRRETVGRPPDTDHWKSASAARGRHH